MVVVHSPNSALQTHISIVSTDENISSKENEILKALQGIIGKCTISVALVKSELKRVSFGDEPDQEEKLSYQGLVDVVGPKKKKEEFASLDKVSNHTIVEESTIEMKKESPTSRSEIEESSDGEDFSEEPKESRKRLISTLTAKADILKDITEYKPPELLNPFGEVIGENDIFYAFEKCDVNKDQRITLPEFFKAIKTLNLDMSKKEVTEQFALMDKNGDKCLDFEEFKTGLLNINSEGMYQVWEKMVGQTELDLKPTKNDYTFEKIETILRKNDRNWQDRVECIHSFTKRMVQKMSKKQFDAAMRPIREPLVIQLGDRRSIVVREACICIAKIALMNSSKLTRWVGRILEKLFEALRLNVEVMSLSAHQAIKTIVRCVPETKKNEILVELIKASRSKHNIVRQRAFEYLTILIETSRVEGTKRNKSWWSKTATQLKQGMTDSSKEVRFAAADAVCELYVYNPELAKSECVSQLPKIQKRKFMERLAEFRNSKPYVE